ncbi:hypothetical protein SAMN05519104_4374 [Rhizobiales bacterium GAS188]|nr:hypothetical protein SAMN05519104_4374 [Rhizobiales bacterium GAS188]
MDRRATVTATSWRVHREPLRALLALAHHPRLPCSFRSSKPARARYRERAIWSRAGLLGEPGLSVIKTLASQIHPSRSQFRLARLSASISSICGIVRVIVQTLVKPARSVGVSPKRARITAPSNSPSDGSSEREKAMAPALDFASAAARLIAARLFGASMPSSATSAAPVCRKGARNKRHHITTLALVSFPEAIRPCQGDRWFDRAV